MEFCVLSVITCVVATIISAVTLFYFYATYKQTYWKKRGVYSPPAHWLFGHFKDAFSSKISFSDAFGALHSQVDNSIPVVGIYVMQKPFLLIRSPEVMKQIFIKDFNIFCNRYFASKRKADIIGSENLFSIDNPRWRYIRSKLSPAFTTGKLKKLFHLMLVSAENMKNYLETQVPENDQVTIECRELCTRYTTDVITSFSFGVQTNLFADLQSELYTRSRKIFDVGLLRTTQMLAVFFFPTLSDYLNGSMLDTSTEYFRNMFWESMKARANSDIKRGDIIDLLIGLKNEEQSPEFRFEGDYLVAQAAILLFAGLETSAITMSFTLFELAKNLEIQEKVYQEIIEKLNKNKILTYESVLDMSYLNQVISETLRLYPPAPIIDRVANENYNIPGTDIEIEKGTAVYASLKGIHEDPRYHPNPLTYDPDRFSEENKPNIQPCTYMPFGEGPRICIGMRIGLLQTISGLITILSKYKVTLNPQYKTEINKRAMFLAPRDGIRLYFQRIENR